MSKVSLTFRFGTSDDAPLLLQFLKNLAEHEGNLSEMKMTEDALRHILATEPHIVSLIAEQEGKAVGAAIWSARFNAMSGGLHLWLFDLCVAANVRGQGIGRQMWHYISAYAAQKGYKKIEWFIHPDNHSAKEFYKRMGAAQAVWGERWVIKA